jgi:hypothetical protein
MVPAAIRLAGTVASAVLALAPGNPWTRTDP